MANRPPYSLLYVHALIAKPHPNDIRTARRHLHTGFLAVQLTHRKHLALHVHNRILLCQARQGFEHDNFEFERSNNFHAEPRFATIVIGVRRTARARLCLFIARAGF